MRTSSLTKTGLSVIMSLVLTASLWAVKRVDMPDNFGKDDWAVSHYKEAVGYLKYMANNQTIQKLVSVPDNLRQAAWDDFWKSFDPAKKISADEYEEAYFARVRYANENFASILQPGWLTDRGEAYIRLGEPTTREKFTMRAGGHDIEVWNYMLPRDIYLVFVDRTGVGDFDLLNTGDMLDEVYLR